MRQETIDRFHAADRAYRVAQAAADFLHRERQEAEAALLSERDGEIYDEAQRAGAQI